MPAAAQQDFTHPTYHENTEIEGEREFNDLIRRRDTSPGPAPLSRSLPIPIPTGGKAEQVPWCGIRLSLYLPQRREHMVYHIWDEVIDCIQDKLGYIRSGAREHIYNAMQIRSVHTVRIVCHVDLFANIKLNDLQLDLIDLTGCRPHIDYVHMM